MFRNPRRILPIVIVLLVLGSGIWYFLSRSGSNVSGALQGSGTVEAVEVSAASEVAGRVMEVLVKEGEVVEAGQPLFRLNDELLKSQRQRAESALAAAQDGLSVAQSGKDAAAVALTAAQVNADAAQANAKAAVLPLKQALEDLRVQQAVARAKAEQAVAAANRAVRETTYLLDNFTVPTTQQGLTAMEAVQMTKEKLDQARANYEPVKYASSSNSVREGRKETLDEAQSDYDAAVRRLEYEAAVHQAQAALDQAVIDLNALQEGPDPDQVAVLEARIAAANTVPEQAQAAVEQAQTGVAQADARLAQAQSQVNQAQAELNLIEVQMDKLTIFAATSGTVLTRNIEPGEVIQPGTAALILAQLDQLTITVYLPEDRYGALKLGAKARVKVDSFPGKTFDAVVEQIADQAEFTPRNVQTQDGRRTTVFAVTLSVLNSEGQLKPGMPADVAFE